MSYLELHFPVIGTEIASDHAYALYGALARLVPKIHAKEMPLRIGPIRGTYEGNGMLRLDSRNARLRIRVRSDDLPHLLPFAGKRLDLDGHAIRLGVPQVMALAPAPNLIARMVVIKASSPKTDPAHKKSRDQQKTKRYQEPEEFLQAVRRELERQSIHAEAELPLNEIGKPRRRIVRIHRKKIVGFMVRVRGATAEESLRLQEAGVGGRAKMGCGFFEATREENQ